MASDCNSAVSYSPLSRIEAIVTSRAAWCVFLACSAAALLRQYFFVHSYWYDEAFLILPIRERSYAELLGPQPYNLVIPPLFLWIERWLYVVGGDGELLLRLPALIAALAALLVMIPLAKVTTPPLGAVLAFAGIAVARSLLEHSSDVRPYTLDLLLTESILLCAALKLSPSPEAVGSRWSTAGLMLLAILGPWLSFPSAFVLGGVSAAWATALWDRNCRRALAQWVLFNTLVVSSGCALWWWSARHMYYGGMIDHWGHNGWGGFPDWQSAFAVGRWLLGRPVEIANYGVREIGLVVVVLAVTGSIAMARRSRATAVLLMVPFLLAVTAALLGKYPLAHRTTFFLLPCMWLLAANGFVAMLAWARQHGWRLAAIGLLLVGWDFAKQVIAIAHPSPRIDYRGAYAYVHEHRRQGDLLWCQMAVVYQTYYGQSAPVLRDHEFAEAERVVGQRRLWVVAGSTRSDLRRRLEDAGGEVIHSHAVSGLYVLLFAPKAPLTRVRHDALGAGRAVRHSNLGSFPIVTRAGPG